jgi:hypothetical protein
MHQTKKHKGQDKQYIIYMELWLGPKNVNFICGNLKSVFHYIVEEETLV